MRNIVLFSTADWDNPFWTNKQHVATQLASLGYRVLYIDSVGLRRPTLTGRDFRRVYERLSKLWKPPREVRDGLYVWSPFVIPLQDRHVVRLMNRALIQNGVERIMARLGFDDPMLWTYNPMTTEFLDLKKFNTVIYHCVDDIKAQPGMPALTLDRAERTLTELAAVTFVTSPRLAQIRSQWTSKIAYLPNVADYDHFSKALTSSVSVPEDLTKIPAPRLGFVGALSSYKVDFELLAHVARSHPEWSLVLIGSVGEGDPRTRVSAINALPNIHLLGPRPYNDLPAYLKGFDVALLPNVLNDYTAAMFPMKFFEYLAAGRPVVATNLPAIQEFSEYIEIAPSYAHFVAAVESTLNGNGCPLEGRLHLARQHTYRARTLRMLEIVKDMDTSTTAGAWKA